MKQPAVLIICAVLALLVSGCTLTYPLKSTIEISGCNESLQEGYYHLNQTSWNSFVMEYARSYHCTGSVLKVGASLNISVILISEELEVSDLATGCMCPRLVTVSAKHLRPGNYTIEVRDYNYVLTREPAFVQGIMV